MVTTNDELNLKETLIKIKSQSGKKPENTELYGLSMHMMNHIGSTDAVLRDELIYSLLSEWVLADLFSPDQLKEILHTAIDGNHLFYRIGEKGKDSIFTRSFSVLIIPLILISDRKSSFLTQQDILKIYDRLIDYCKSEKDTRGYVAGKGWAHSVAHTADAFEDLVQSPYIERKHLLKILEVLQCKICSNDETYLYEEDERIAAAVARALNRKLLDIKGIEQWLLSFYAVPDFDRLPESAVLRMLRPYQFKVHLSRLMGEKRINIADLSRLTGLHRNGIAKLYNEETDGVKFGTLNRICETLDCKIQDIIEYVKEVIFMAFVEVSSCPFAQTRTYFHYRLRTRTCSD